MSNPTEKPNQSQGDNNGKSQIPLLGKCDVCGIFPSIWRWFAKAYLCNDHANAKAKEYIKKQTEK